MICFSVWLVFSWAVVAVVVAFLAFFSLFLSSFSCFFFSFSSACALRELTCSCSVTMTLNVVSSLRFLFFFWDETEGGWRTDKISETVSIRGSGGGGGDRECVHVTCHPQVFFV